MGLIRRLAVQQDHPILLTVSIKARDKVVIMDTATICWFTGYGLGMKRTHRHTGNRG